MTIFDDFRAAADPVKAIQMRAYMRDQFAFLGIPSPVRRNLSRNFLKTANKTQIDWSFVDDCWSQAEREFQYLAIDYLSNRSRVQTPTDIPRLQQLIVTKSWWDTVDGLDMVVGDIAQRHPEVNPIMIAWSTDDNIWLRRVAIDHQLLRKERTDTGLLEQILINNLGQTEFFINKAIGWILRDYSKTNPTWVREFIAIHQGTMASLSIREASKYL